MRGKAAVRPSARERAPGPRGPWRFLLDPALDGAGNLAIDEAMLERYASSRSALAPTLRLYAWNPGALSLGRFQAAAGHHDPTWLRNAGLDLVRRPTGGKAVLHEDERTYSVVGQLGGDGFSGGVIDTYRQVAGALVAALRALGVEAEIAGRRQESRGRSSGPACFLDLGAHEIAVGGLKLVGSAQLRRAGAFLQHGSIPLRFDGKRLTAAVGSTQPIEGHAVDLERALGRTPDLERLDQALVGGFERSFGVDLEPGTLSEAEAGRAAWLRCWKYDSASWTLEGRFGARERRWGERCGDAG